MKTSILAFVVAGSVATVALANNGTLLPLDQYQAGTESTTLVPNGDFEGPLAGNWVATGSPSIGTPTGPNVSAVNGTKAAHFDGNLTTEPNLYSQSVPVMGGADYVLSGYLWNSSADGGSFALIEALNGATFINNVALQPNTNGVNGANGVFGYIQINTGAATSINIEAEFDQVTVGMGPALAAQIDNVALTPAAAFVAPRAVPEPASLSLLAGTLAIARRRR